MTVMLTRGTIDGIKRNIAYYADQTVILALCSALEQAWAERDEAIGQRDERARRAAGLIDQVNALRKGHDRYETARRLSPAQWADVWKLNISTGKPFDEIIDDLRPFTSPPTRQRES